MKLPATRRLILLPATTLLWILSKATQTTACKYDLLAMCCVEYNNGHCTRWRNCCELQLSSGENDETQGNQGSQGPDGSSGNINGWGRDKGSMGAVTLVASSACVSSCENTCLASRGGGEEGEGEEGEGEEGEGGAGDPDDDNDGISSSYWTLSACYSSCAMPPDSDPGCIVMSSPTIGGGTGSGMGAMGAMGFGPLDMCCTNITDARGFPCDEWQSCQTVQRRPSKYEMYMPIAGGSCIERSGCMVYSGPPGQSPSAAKTAGGPGNSAVRGPPVRRTLQEDNAPRWKTSSMTHPDYDCLEECANPAGIPYMGPMSFGAPCVEIPTLWGHATAFVPMEHISCGIDCGTHGLATEDGNLEMPVTVSMCCDGSSIASLLIEDVPEDVEVEEAIGTSSWGGVVIVAPFTVDDLEEECEEAMGGSWPLPGTHHNSEQSVVTTISEEVTVRAQCDGAGEVEGTYEVTLEVTCHDLNWFVPPP